MGTASYCLFSARNEKNNNKAYGKSQICIENAKIEKPRKSLQGKFINNRCDFLGNANFGPIFQICDLPP